jgi:hypothetical protein
MGWMGPWQGPGRVVILSYVMGKVGTRCCRAAFSEWVTPTLLDQWQCLESAGNLLILSGYAQFVGTALR